MQPCESKRDEVECMCVDNVLLLLLIIQKWIYNIWYSDAAILSCWLPFTARNWYHCIIKFWPIQRSLQIYFSCHPVVSHFYVTRSVYNDLNHIWGGNCLSRNLNFSFNWSPNSSYNVLAWSSPFIKYWSTNTTKISCVHDGPMCHLLDLDFNQNKYLTGSSWSQSECRTLGGEKPLTVNCFCF